MQIYIDPTAREFILARGAPKSITIEFDKNNSAKSGASPEMIHPTVWLGKSTNYTSGQYEQEDIEGITVYYQDSLPDKFQKISIKTKKVFLIAKILTAVGE